jgi:hypothetical protein
MGTDRYREDICDELKKFERQNAGMRPTVLKVNWREAMGWQGLHATQTTQSFVGGEISEFVNGLLLHGRRLAVSVELLNVDSDERTRFE